jgi:hypothetical protein
VATDIDRHLDVLAILSFAMAGLTSAFLLAMLFGAGAMFGFGFGRPGGMETVMIGFVLVPAIAIVGLYVAAGVGLKNRRSGSRVLAIVVSALSLLSFPLGTAYGVYGLYVLTRPNADAALAA